MSEAIARVYLVRLNGDANNSGWLIYADDEAEARSCVASYEMAHRTARTTSGVTQFINDGFNDPKKAECSQINSGVTLNAFGNVVVEYEDNQYTLVKHIAIQISSLQ